LIYFVADNTQKASAAIVAAANLSAENMLAELYMFMGFLSSEAAGRDRAEI